MNIIFFEKLDSTNAFAKKNIDKFDDKTVIIAHEQTNGYGRFKRNWVDFGDKNIFMTIIVKPSEKIEKLYANFTQYLTVCVCEELNLLGLEPKIKWPNDILVNGKKIAGILAESVIKCDKLKGIVIGIGFNIFIEQDELNKVDIPITALNIEGVNIDKKDFIEKITERFFKNYDEFLSVGFSLIKDYYESHAYIPKECKIEIFNKTINGNFIGFNNDGELLIDSDNEIKAVNMGEFVK